jgi:hypothetical protein
MPCIAQGNCADDADNFSGCVFPEANDCCADTSKDIYGNDPDCEGTCGGGLGVDECGTCDGDGLDNDPYTCEQNGYVACCDGTCGCTGGDCPLDTDGDGICDSAEEEGCADASFSNACNYDSTVGLDHLESMCKGPGSSCVNGIENCPAYSTRARTFTHRFKMI